MKTQSPPFRLLAFLYRRRSSQFAAWLALASALMIAQVRALDVIDPTGVNYTSVSDSSHFDGSFVSANLFNQNLTGVAVGANIFGAEFAKNGSGDSFVAFQLDQVYTNVGSVFYAQRNGFDPSQDKVGIISIWASSTTPFGTADPGTPPNSVVAITNTTGAQWTEYLLTNTVSGQFFLLKLQQTSVAGNPGGTELRLGAILGIAPTFTLSPTNKTVYAGGAVRFNSAATGTAPLTYTWVHGTTTLINGGRISGADTGNLVITNVNALDAGAYSLTVSNSAGSTNVIVNLAVVTAPTNAAEVAVISKAPRAFWQLNEPAGSTTALDLVGSFDGTYGSLSGSGAVGPQPPTYPGFSQTNGAVQTFAFTVDSAVTVPPMNISNTNAVTILAWIYQDGAAGPQQPYTGIVYCRGGSGQTSAGLIFSGDGTQLAYQWAANRFNFGSGLVVPTNQWTLVALVYRTNFTTLYCGSSNGIVLSSVDNVANFGQAFEVPMKIGVDTDAGESSRTFNGFIDNVAFFDRALSTAEINSIYQAGTGLVPTLQIISQTATNLTIFQGQPINFSVQVTGSNPAFQWYKQNAAIPGATNSTFTIPFAKTNDSGNFFVIASNSVNTATSAIITVTVPNFVVLPLGPSGGIYSGVSASSSYPDPNYVSANLFDSDLTAVPIGAHLGGKDWADDGFGTAFAPAYFAFQVDQVYAVNAIFYAQRNSQSGQTIDKVTALSIWASQTTPFAAGDPGTTPDAVVSIPETDAAVLHAYALPATITGKYFVVKAEQNPIVSGSNIGGNEFRLGVQVTPALLAFTNSAGGLTLSWPSPATLQQANDVTGPWVNATTVTNGVPIPPTAARQFYRIVY